MSFSALSFAGTWRDNRGYNISICVSGNKLQGSYSEFGFVQATLSENGTTAQGRWYEARNPFAPSSSFDCPNGGFTWKLQSSSKFLGNYDCADTNEQDNFDWEASRFSPDITPTSTDCGELWSTNDDASGAWIIDPYIPSYWDICIDKQTHKYHSSYECDTSLDCYGYETGFWYENGKILIGSFTNYYPDGNKADGAAITALLSDGSLVHYLWAEPVTVQHVLTKTQHIAEYNITQDVYDYPNITQCQRNQDIYDQRYQHFSSSSLPDDYTTIHVTTNAYQRDSTNFNTSGAQSIYIVGVYVVAFVLVNAFF